MTVAELNCVSSEIHEAIGRKAWKYSQAARKGVTFEKASINANDFLLGYAFEQLQNMNLKDDDCDITLPSSTTPDTFKRFISVIKLTYDERY